MLRCKCGYCGESKTEEDFRPYYGKAGHYSYCRSCEQIETKRKNIIAKQKRTALSSSDIEMLDKINALYEARRKAGLKTFGGAKRDLNSLVDTQLNKVKELQ